MGTSIVLPTRDGKGDVPARVVSPPKPMRSFASDRSCERAVYAIVAGVEPDVSK